MKISYNYTETGVLGDFPLTRRHCNTKCVSCDGPEEPLHIYIEMHYKRRWHELSFNFEIKYGIHIAIQYLAAGIKKETVGFCVPFSNPVVRIHRNV